VEEQAALSARGRRRLSQGAILMGLHGEPLILASLSPRRRQLLRMLGIQHRALVPDVEEGPPLPSETPASHVERLARAKASWVPPEERGYAVLSADTIVVLDGTTLGKPVDDDDARRMLASLSEKWHEVYTGLCLRRLRDGKIVTGHERSRVHFARLFDEDIDRYIATREPFDKAGAYGIQGYGGLLVDRIEGCYFNVMGLPLPRLRRLARELEEGSNGGVRGPA
jgi:septum formation protein